MVQLLSLSCSAALTTDTYSTASWVGYGVGTSSRIECNAVLVSTDIALAVVSAAVFVTSANTLATLGDSPARSCTETVSQLRHVDAAP